MHSRDQVVVVTVAARLGVGGCNEWLRLGFRWVRLCTRTCQLRIESRPRPQHRRPADMTLISTRVIAAPVSASRTHETRPGSRPRVFWRGRTNLRSASSERAGRIPPSTRGASGKRDESSEEWPRTSGTAVARRRPAAAAAIVLRWRGFRRAEFVAGRARG